MNTVDFVKGKKIVYAGLDPYVEKKERGTLANKDGEMVIMTSFESVEHLCFFIRFEDGITLTITDDASYCCERRYLTCDDDCSSIVGGTLLNIDDVKVEEIDVDDWDVKEIKFIKIETDKGFITLCAHNEHNGYYGGFEISYTLHLGKNENEQESNPL